VSWGEKDRVVPLGHADVLAAGIAGAKKVVLAGARHPCYLDVPEVFHAELLRFLGGVTAPGSKNAATRPADEEP
jgi:pimeloyl-ACP methyl ester carboxylesterase